jgi:hypothetical protein
MRRPAPDDTAASRAESAIQSRAGRRTGHAPRPVLARGHRARFAVLGGVGWQREAGGAGAVDARLSPDGRTLFVDESRIGAVGAFAVHGGTLTELPTSPTSLPAGATPAGIVVN